MLKSTIELYIEKFGNTMRIMTPLIVVEILISVFQVMAGIAGYERQYVTLLITTLFLIILSVSSWLIYTPATVRAFQKRSEGEGGSIRESVSFQKGHKWNYFVFFLWMCVYSTWYVLLSIVPIVAGIYFGLGFAYLEGSANFVIGVTLMFACIAFGAYMIYRNYPKLFFALNVYVSKNKLPKASIQESMYLGETYRNLVWRYMLGILAIAIIGLGFVGFISYVGNLLFPGSMAANSIGLNSANLLVNLIIVMPLAYIYMSKSYLSMLILDAAKKGQIELSVTEAELVTRGKDGVIVEEVDEIDVVENPESKNN